MTIASTQVNSRWFGEHCRNALAPGRNYRSLFEPNSLETQRSRCDRAVKQGSQLSIVPNIRDERAVVACLLEHAGRPWEDLSILGAA
jgi:hypothetical protein